MITELEAISFLKEHQPMPSDSELTSEDIQKYEQVREFFLNNVNRQCIPLFLNSFGGKDGFGVYQMVEDVILMYSKEEVLPHLVDAFSSSSEYVLYWCIQLAANFPDADLFIPLKRFLENDDEDIKVATITSLAQLALNNIKTKEIIEVLKCEIEQCSDMEIKEFLEEVLEDILNN